MESEQGVPRQPSLLLRLIALFKFCKAALLVAVGLGAVHLVHAGLAAHAWHWLGPLAMKSDRRAVQHLISWLSGLSPERLEVLASAAFFYAGLYLVEGAGLWLARRWAEYLVAIATLLFVPFEVFALTRRVSLTRLVALIVNLGVAGYLIHRLRRAHASSQPPDPGP